MLVQRAKTLMRLLLQNCLSRSFWQATCVETCKTFNIQSIEVVEGRFRLKAN